MQVSKNKCDRSKLLGGASENALDLRNPKTLSLLSHWCSGEVASHLPSTGTRGSNPTYS